MVKLVKNRVGLTLIEVVVAVTIFAILIGPLAGFLYVSNQRGRDNVIARQAMAVAEARLEYLRQTGFQGFRLEEGDMDVIEEATEGKFTVFTHARFDPAVEMTRVTVIVSHKNRDFSLSTLVSRYRRGG